MSAPAPSAPRWLFGPVPDLVLGCGLGYGLVFVLLVLFGPEARQLAPEGLMPLALLVTGTPHYGATLLRVYERSEDRRKYAFFSVWATLLIWGLFVLGLHVIWVGSLLLTVFLTWSPWHYTGQNYGIALMFLRRRGVAVAPGTKRVIYVSFIASYLLTVLAIHGAVESADYAPVQYGSAVYRFLPLGIPPALQDGLMLCIGAVWLVASAAAALLLLRAGRPRDLGPAAALAGIQALWFAIPVLARHGGWLQHVEPLSAQQAAYAFLWVAIGHSVQYLWVTAYYARQSRGGARLGPWFGKALCAGAAIWTVPALLFAPGLLGTIPFDVGLSTLIAATVNLHHFVLDGAIWKLRDGPVARVLIRPAAPAAPVASGDLAAVRAAPHGRILGGAVLLAGAGCVALVAVSTLEEEYGVRRALARGDVPRVRQAADRLSLLGRDSAAVRANLGVLAASRGDLATARQEIDRSLALWPTPEGWRALGWMHQRAGEPAKAISPYRTALTLRPGWADVANDLAWIRATHENFAVRSPRRALELATQAADATGWSDPRVLDTLAAAYAAASRFPNAVEVAEQAEELAREQGRTALAEAVATRLAGYAAGEPFRETAAAGRNRSDVRFQVTGPEGQRIEVLDPGGGS